MTTSSMHNVTNANNVLGHIETCPIVFSSNILPGEILAFPENHSFSSGMLKFKDNIWNSIYRFQFPIFSPNF